MPLQRDLSIPKRPGKSPKVENTTNESLKVTEKLYESPTSFKLSRPLKSARLLMTENLV
jgi:hypothetical protein